MKTLDSLQSRVDELTQDDDSPPVETSAAREPRPLPAIPEAEPISGPVPGPVRPRNLDADSMALLRRGFAELELYTKHKAFPEYFGRLAEATGLRMLLLKRWTSGLQVYMEKNIRMPSEAKKKRQDGRAPIPCKKSDVFTAAAEDATVYAGPVPVQHFPLDLTLMLGRGSRDRQIVILPVPTQNHWNTFLYLDADEAAEQNLAVAELLAHFALSRMCLLNKGIRPPQGRVAKIRKGEQARRKQAASAAQARRRPPEADQSGLSEMDIDPFAVRSKAPAGAAAPEPPETASSASEAASRADTNRSGDVDPFTPRSGSETGAIQTKTSALLAAIEAAAQDDASGPSAGDGKPGAEEDAPAAEQVEPVEAAESGPAGADPGYDIDAPLPGKGEGLTPELLISRSGELPALPKAACHIMAVIEDPRTTATKLEKALAMDQALTAKVLRIANSPFYGAVREIRTVSEAIVRLGFVTIRNWTLVTAARSVFLAPGAGMMYQKIWTQSVLSAMTGQLVAQALGRMDAEAIFIGGLMQNIGQLVLARSHPVLFQEILVDSETEQRPYHEVERRRLGFDHGELGAILIREWNLSQELEEAVRWHHDFQNPEAKNQRYAAMIALGEEIAWQILEERANASSDRPVGEQDFEEEPEEVSAAARYLGLSAMQLEKLKAEAEKLTIDPHFFN